MERLIQLKFSKLIFLYFNLIFFSISFVNAQVSGTVFRDFNGNGIKDNTTSFNEIGLAGVIVNAYNPSGGTLTVNYSGGGTSTNNTGQYSVTGGVLGQIRLEFILPGTSFYATMGSSGGTTVMFPASATQNLAVNYPAEYSDSNPKLVTPTYVNGDNQVSGSSSSTGNSIFSYNYDATGLNTIATQGQTGAVWGTAYHKQSGKLFYSAFGKRHVNWGPLGPNGIYVTTSAKTATNTSNTGSFVNLNSVNSSFNAGNPTRNFSPGLGDKTQGNYDENMILGVGTTGMGDLDVSEDGQYLYTVNLNDRKVWRIEVGVNGAAPTSSGQIVAYTAFPNPCTNSTFRPFAIKVYRGELYIGGVCDGVTDLTNQTSAVNRNNLKATIYKTSLITAPSSAIWTEVFSMPLTYNRDANLNFGGGATSSVKYIDPNGTDNALTIDAWHPWARSWSDINLNLSVFYPQPMLLDIEMDIDGSMILGFGDREGHQVGNYNLGVEIGNFSTYYGTANGDILRVFNNNGTFILENNGTAGGITTAGVGDGDGPGGGEFYYQDNFELGGGPLGVNNNPCNHDEIAAGGLALYYGSDQVVNTVFDAKDSWDSGGTRWYSNNDGTAKNGLLLYGAENISLFGKATGVGDVELLVSPPPLEIGNRVWMDTDSDGVQDADEMGLDGVTVKLFQGTTLVSTKTTANGGQYYFNTADGLLPNTAYTIRIEAANIPSGKFVTLKDQPTGGVQDMGDNDAALVGANADITYTTGNAGENNHTLDFGFSAALTCSSTVTAIPGTCNSATNQYTLTGTVTFSNPPSTGTLTVQISGGGSQVFNAPFTSPQSYSIAGQTSDGVNHTVTAMFSVDGTCTSNTTYTAPSSCSGCPPIQCGTTTVQKN